MGKRLGELAARTCYHGNAGIASAFAALAHKKIKPGGVLALVLPLSVANGLSWAGLREMLAKHYTGLTVLTIAAADNDDLSFSADTGMAECLVIARKLKLDEASSNKASFTSLSHRPRGLPTQAQAGRLLDGSQVVKLASRTGRTAGRHLWSGDDQAGETMDCALQRRRPKLGLQYDS